MLRWLLLVSVAAVGLLSGCNKPQEAESGPSAMAPRKMPKPPGK